MKNIFTGKTRFTMDYQCSESPHSEKLPLVDYRNIKIFGCYRCGKELLKFKQLPNILVRKQLNVSSKLNLLS